jgi:hypothetical protein
MSTCFLEAKPYYSGYGVPNDNTWRWNTDLAMVGLGTPNSLTGEYPTLTILHPVKTRILCQDQRLTFTSLSNVFPRAGSALTCKEDVQASA